MDKRPARGVLKVAHIMVKVDKKLKSDEALYAEVETEVKAKLDEIAAEG